MKTEHMQPIVTNARQGLPLSVANRRRANTGVGWLVSALVAFWLVVGFIVSSL